MRPERVAAGVALTVAFASVIGVASVGSQQPTNYRPLAQGFRPVTLRGAPTMAILPDPADLSAGRLTASDRLVEPGPRVGVPSRPDIPQPVQAPAAVPRPTPTPRPTPRPRSTAAPAAGAVAWNHDPEVSWYGPEFYGNRTACGQTLTTTLLGVANRTLPCGTLVTFRNPANGRTATVPVVDRGPYVSGRQWDLTGGLCVALDHCYTGPIDWHLGP